MKKIKVGIIGYTGRLGKPLMEILSSHSFADVVYAESRTGGRNGNLSEAEIVFLTLPYGESEKYLSELGRKKIIDLSIDHRDDVDWIYGLPEIFGNEIRKATKVANPGCYATSVILGLYPLKGKINGVRIASASGISGSGKEVSTDDNFLVYLEGRQHPQIREMERVMELENILLVPQRIDTADRGIVSTVFAETDKLENLFELYNKTYEKCPFIRIRTEISTRNVIGTNYCDIKVLQFGKDVVVISALDNLIKGGAGQAVQNFNLMFGFQETAGLI